MKTLNLHLLLDRGREYECALDLRARLEPESWAILAALAAEIVAAHESAALGQTTLVVTVNPKEAAAILAGKA